MRVALYAALVALICAAIVGSEMRREPVYAFDGFAYGVRAQLDAGIPYDRALAQARAVYAGKPAMRFAHTRKWLTAPVPKWWNLFRVRVLYPWLASLLWHRYGFASLFVVSAAMYVLAALLTYGYLLALVRPAVAAAIALVAAGLSPVRLLGHSDLTDMTSYAALVAALWAMTAYARRGTAASFAAACIASALLVLVRPLAYVLVCAALPLLFSKHRMRGAALVAVECALFAANAAALALAHAGEPFPHHYVAALTGTIVVAAEWALEHPLWILASIALVVQCRRTQAQIALGALCSALPTMVLDPFPTDVLRVVVLPSAIALACGSAYALAAISPACRATTGQPLYARPGRSTPPLAGRLASKTRTSAS